MTSLVKALLITGLGIGTALASMGAQAESNGYVKPSNALIRVGYQFTKDFSGELLGAASVSSDTLDGASFKVDSAYGAYLEGSG